MLSPIYFESLIETIASRGIAELDHCTGAISVPLPGDRTLYLTPGWEGEALSWAIVVDGYGDVPAFGNIETAWTGRIDADVALYVSELRRLRKEVS